MKAADSLGLQPLHYALKSESHEAVRLLLDAKASMDSSKMEQRSAAYSPSSDRSASLLSPGASPSADPMPSPGRPMGRVSLPVRLRGAGGPPMAAVSEGVVEDQQGSAFSPRFLRVSRALRAAAEQPTTPPPNENKVQHRGIGGQYNYPI